MSSTALTPGYGPLEVFFDAEEGVSFKADDGGFLSPRERDGFTCIEIVKEKNQSSKFLVENLGDGKVRLKDSRGLYLSRTDHKGRHVIVPQQMTPDASCEYQVFTRNGKVIFKGDNGLFLSRFENGLYKTGTGCTLESVKKDADKYCEFVVDIGDLVRPTFEIVNVTVDESFSLNKKRETVSEDKFVNTSSLAEMHTLKMHWKKDVTEVTTWKRFWALNSAVVIDAFAIRFLPFLSYDSAQGKSVSRHCSKTTDEEVTVGVPPGTTATAELVITIDEISEIPFTATIKKTKANGEIKEFTEQGTWKGVFWNAIEDHITYTFNR